VIKGRKSKRQITGQLVLVQYARASGLYMRALGLAHLLYDLVLLQFEQ